MARTRALLLLGVAIGIMAPLVASGPVEPVQAQDQAPPPEGFRIIGNIYWVGGEYGSYLITTPQGHILHDTGTSEMHDVIVSNVKKLGFDVNDIRMIISSHAHFDHVQGHAAMKKLTGAQVIALGGDAAALEAGQDNSAGGFRGLVAVHVDRVIKDGETISLGGVTLRALWVPGHTQGATVWMTTVSEGGRNYSVAFRGGETPNAGVQLIGNPRHPGVIDDTKMTLQRMKSLQPPDLFLHNHRQNLGRPLDPALPVNPLCVTCMDAEAYTAMLPTPRSPSQRDSAKRRRHRSNSFDQRLPSAPPYGYLTPSIAPASCTAVVKNCSACTGSRISRSENTHPAALIVFATLTLTPRMLSRSFSSTATHVPFRWGHAIPRGDAVVMSTCRPSNTPCTCEGLTKPSAPIVQAQRATVGGCRR